MALTRFLPDTSSSASRVNTTRSSNRRAWLPTDSKGAGRGNSPGVYMDITTPDPAFDPSRFVTINGYEYAPVGVDEHHDARVVGANRPPFISAPSFNERDEERADINGSLFLRADFAARMSGPFQQALAERDAMLVEAAQIIGQIELDHRHPPAPDSMERRLERARKWLGDYRSAGDADV